MKKKNPVRNKVVQVRLCEHEHKRAQAAARAAGVTASTYMRSLLIVDTERELLSVLGNLQSMPASDRPLLARLIDEVKRQIPFARSQPPKADPELVRQVLRIGKNINQISHSLHVAHVAGRLADAASLEMAFRELTKELHQVRNLVGLHGAEGAPCTSNS